MAKTRATIDRYFEAFEAGTLKTEMCNEKVRDLRTRMEWITVAACASSAFSGQGQPED